MLRRDFSKGWFPNADAVNGPPNCLLRMDNLVLDEEGVLALRRGGVEVESPISRPTVHSLYTTHLGGTRYRMAGAGNNIYANGNNLGVTWSHPQNADIAMGSQLGQIFMGRGDLNKKWDGTTVRNWGIHQTGGAPTVAPVAADYRVFATCNQSETGWQSPEAGDFEWAEDQDGVPNQAIELIPDPITGKAIVRRVYASRVDFTTYVGGQTGTDTDLVEVWVYLTEPAFVNSIAVQIDIDDASFKDYYFHAWKRGDPVVVELDRDETIAAYEGEFYGTPQERDQLYEAITRAQPSGPITKKVQPAFEGAPGWTKYTVARGKFIRAGVGLDLGWNTVKGVRLVLEANQGGEHASVRFSDVRIIGGLERPLSGEYRYRYVYLYKSGQYDGVSAPSPASDPETFEANAATVTIPADASRDPQVNELWLYRMGGFLDRYYRIAVVDMTSVGTGSVPVTDKVPDVEALIEYRPLVVDNAPPPANIIGVSDPYFDRIFVLTSDGFICPSRRLDPDSFAQGHAIRVGHSGETPYWIKRAFGGLYIGTSRDIYRLEGTGGELDYGLLDFLLRPLNVGSPPISRALAHEGDFMIYLAADGWRYFNGESSRSVMEDVDLLYRGQTRHGVSPANLRGSGARFRAAIADGMLSAITPEGGQTAGSTVLHRKDLRRDRWYRHVYPTTLYSIHREPDGTLIAGDTEGHIVQLDSGTTDRGTAIPVTLHTIEDHDDKPYIRKDHWNARLLIDTGNVNASTRFKFDNTLDTAVNIQHDGILQFYKSLDKTSYRVQLQITGDFSRFRLYNWEITYRERPQTLIFAEPKPSELSGKRKRFGGFNISIMTFSQEAEVTPILDGVAQTVLKITTTDVRGQQLVFASKVGYNCWAKVSCATGFELYTIEPIVLEVFPQQIQGRLPNLAMEDEGEILGLDLKVCTLGVEREFTPVIDNTADTGRNFKITSHADEPVKVTIRFDAPVDARSFALSVDGPVEVYDVL